MARPIPVCDLPPGPTTVRALRPSPCLRRARAHSPQFQDRSEATVKQSAIRECEPSRNGVQLVSSTTRQRLLEYFEFIVGERELRGDLSDRSALRFRYDHETFEAFVRRRSNGTEVLTIVAVVATVDETLEALRYVTAHAADGTFAALAATTDSATGELELEVWHTLLADTVNRTGLTEVLDSLSRAAWYHRERLSSFSAPERTSEDQTARPTGEILADLQDLVGMSSVKSELTAIVKAEHVGRKRVEHGLVDAGSSPNLVFVGNPGTGKTTVARLVAELYKAIDVVPVGHLVETNRAGLVAEYLGQTAAKTERVCESALGGVLFIDEAYALTPESPRDYGGEAIATLIQFMENHRDEMAVIVAGYPDEMQTFLNANPGLSSRFDITVPFPDYSNEELEEIFLALVHSNDYDLTSEAHERLSDFVASMSRGHGFGNAREMRKLFQHVTRRQAQELPQPSLAGTTLLRRIDADAFPAIPPPTDLPPSDPTNIPGYV